MPDRPEIRGLQRVAADRVEVTLRAGMVEHRYGVQLDQRPPLTVLVAEDALQVAVRDWPELYREVMAGCRALFRDAEATVAA